MRTRREVVQGLIVSIGGASLLSACGGEADIIATKADTSEWRYFTNREMDLVARICDLIFPRTDTPSAVDANVPGYIDGLMADWASDVSKRSQHQSLADLDTLLRQASGGDFVLLAEDEAVSVLTLFDQKAFEGGDEYGGYRALKSIISESYFASEQGAVQELKWVPAPGRWDPSVPVESIS